MFSLEGHEETLADVSYLARSANRVRVLDTLATAPASRRALAERMEITRPTLSRILDELVGRGWITRDGRTYRITPVGRFLVGEFESFVERLRPVSLLDDAVQWFPPDGFGFRLERLATAEVVTTTPTNVLAPTTHVDRVLRRATDVRVLSPAVLPSAIETCHERTVDGDQRVVAVVTEDVVASIRADAGLAATLHEMVVTGQTVVFRHDGPIPYPILVADDRATILLSDEDGAPHVALSSDDERVRDWATSMVATHREEATQVAPTAFTV